MASLGRTKRVLTEKNDNASKRPRSDGDAKAKNNKSSGDRRQPLPSCHFFVRVLRECGLTPYTSAPHLLSRDSTVVAKAIAKRFELDPSKPEEANKFAQGIMEYLDEDDTRLAAALMPLEADPDGTATQGSAVSAHRAAQESLLRMLLQVRVKPMIIMSSQHLRNTFQINLVQEKLLPWTMEKMVMLAMEDDEGENRVAKYGSTTEQPISRQILMQVRDE